MEYQILPFPSERAIVIDAGRLASRRHIVHALIEVDVTRAREFLRASSVQTGVSLSFTAFVVASLARAIESNPIIHAYRDWRGRLVVFREVDIVTMIESGAGTVAIPHIIREANRKTVSEASNEIRSIKTDPEKSNQRKGLIFESYDQCRPRYSRWGSSREVREKPDGTDRKRIGSWPGARNGDGI